MKRTGSDLEGDATDLDVAEVQRRQTVVGVLSGGNLDLRELRQILQEGDAGLV